MTCQRFEGPFVTFSPTLTNLKAPSFTGYNPLKKKYSGDMSMHNMRCGSILVMALGAETLEMQLIKTALPMAYILHPPNPVRVTLPLARSLFPVALLYRQTQSDIYWNWIALHRCMLGANSAGDIFSSECVNFLQNNAMMLVPNST